RRRKKATFMPPWPSAGHLLFLPAPQPLATRATGLKRASAWAGHSGCLTRLSSSATVAPSGPAEACRGVQEPLSPRAVGRPAFSFHLPYGARYASSSDVGSRGLGRLARTGFRPFAAGVRS